MIRLLRIAVMLLLVLYAFTPYVAFGFSGGGCGCVHGDKVCGTGGFICHCCGGPDTDIWNDGVPSYSKCMKFQSQDMVVQPPAEYVSSPGTMPYLAGTDTYPAADERGVEGYRAPILRPPISASFV